MIIGITGGTGCGKTTLLQILEEVGCVVLDCDAIYHKLLKTDPSLLAAIDARFPNVVENGVLKREALGLFVFSNPAALQDLNQITHSAVKQEVLHVLNTKPKLAAIDAIGLFESGLNQLCQLTVAVTAPDDQRIARLMARDNISEKYARIRIAAQRPQKEFEALCDHTLVNNGSETAFREKCLVFLQKQGIITLS